MKKVLFFLTAIAVTTLTANGKEVVSNVWSGSQALSWDAELETGNAAAAQEGRTLKITFTATGESPQLQVYHKDANWSGTDLASGKEIAAPVFQIVLNATEAANAKERGLYIKGQDATLTSVDIVYQQEGQSSGDQTLFDNPAGTAMNWNEICEHDQTVTALFEAGDKIIVTVISKDANEQWPKVILRNSNSESVLEQPMNDVSVFPCEVTFALNDAVITSLSKGMRISGAGVTISKVILRKGGSEQPEQPGETLKPGDEKVLWEGAETLSWNDVAAQNANIGGLLEPNDQILVTVSAKGNADWPKVMLRDRNYTAVTDDILLNEVNSFPYIATFTLTASQVSKMQDGFTVCGDGVTITKVVLKKSGNGGEQPEQPGDDNKDIDFTGLTETVVWTGDQAISWKNEDYQGIQFDTYAVKQDMFAGLSSGDIIKLVIESEANAEYAVDYKAGEDWTWTSMPDLYTSVSGMIAFKTPSSEIAQWIADRGIVIKGIRYHLKQISVWSKGAMSLIETNISENEYTGVRYNILGQQVDESYKGIVIINSKKYLQR